MSQSVLDPSGWFKFTGPMPYVAVSGFAVGPCGRFPILYRGDKVRSARNCWALPSGLHEVGLTAEQQFAVELKEELNLDLIPGTAEPVFMYENIMPGEPGVGGGWHWVILVLAAKVKTLDTLRNAEPDKHPNIDMVDLRSFPYADGFWTLNWAPSLGRALNQHQQRVMSSVLKLGQTA